MVTRIQARIAKNMSHHLLSPLKFRLFLNHRSHGRGITSEVDTRTRGWDLAWQQRTSNVMGPQAKRHIGAEDLESKAARWDWM